MISCTEGLYPEPAPCPAIRAPVQLELGFDAPPVPHTPIDWPAIFAMFRAFLEGVRDALDSFFETETGRSILAFLRALFGPQAAPAELPA